MTVEAFSYLRVSGPGQVNGDGYPRQRAEISVFAKAAGIQVVREFVERAVPGKTEWEDRPAWVEMMAEMNGVRTILIERLDRLARDLMVQEHIIADLKKRGITLISSAEPDLCSDDPTRILFRQIMGAIAAYDRTMIVRKMASARKRMKVATGRCEGRKPFGHRVGEKETLDLMRRYQGFGFNFTAIANKLNEARIPTRYGGEWIPQGVCSILRRHSRRQKQ